MDTKLDKYKSQNTIYYPVSFLSRNKIREVEFVKDRNELLFVRKTIHFNPNGSEPEPNFYFNREVRLLAQSQDLGLPFVELVEYKTPVSEEEPGFIVTKYMEGGNLMQLIKKSFSQEHNIFQYYSSYTDEPLDGIIFNSSYPHPDIIYDDTRKNIIMYGLARAIQFLHHEKILHRDIKPENILLDASGDPYLSDFGVSRELEQNGSFIQSGQKGTIPYMAPEVFLSDTCELQTDLFAFGVTVLMMLAGELKLDLQSRKVNAYEMNQKKLNQKIIDGYKYYIPESIPNCFHSLITKCCDATPSKRPLIDSIVSDFENGKLNLPNVNQSEFKNYIERLNSKKHKK